ncbi:hypothetical protein SAMN05892873_12350 [Aeromonas veronii]|nr:hypothetical protein SAMN05892873_12350 [Aeromonas veronii]
MPYLGDNKYGAASIDNLRDRQKRKFAQNFCHAEK